ncbi:ATP-dependent translocase ABCB1-like isoform X2 [Bufo gargarizans]|uniref:ATP-dependent translocase ABCB1-like isoform X2 n=1 Tax=Bufo gargarizans TaxID=30331 RepID=UPI001CF58247|nr:ATP-dependent translocase ABCB1-like isoform X2 [Bufo gargarizans]
MGQTQTAASKTGKATDYINISDHQCNGKINGKIKNSDASESKERKNSHVKVFTKEMVGVLELLQYADKWDIILMVIGIVCAVGNGATIPLNTVVFGQAAEGLVVSGNNVNASSNISGCSSGFETEIPRFTQNFLIIGFASFIFSFLQMWTFIISATRQTMRIRQMCFSSILHQEMAWFDSYQIGTLNSRLTEDINTIYEGLSIKWGICVQSISSAIFGITIGFVLGWKLAIVILASGLILSFFISLWIKLSSVFTIKELKAYGMADAVAEEVLTAIRTVASFNGQEKAMEKYNTNLIDAKAAGIKKSIISNVIIGVSELMIFGVYGLALWYGTHLLDTDPKNYRISNVLTVFFSVLNGTVSFGNVFPCIESISNARAAAYEIYRIINKPRHIDSGSTEGYKPDKLVGNIKFKNIHFAYPSRPDVQVLKGLNLKVPAGKTIALVGMSGCGKSTTIQLLQRFYDTYDTTKGEITLDGHDIRSLNIKWLRDNIGLVGQEPVLFATTIKENICFGRDGVTDTEIEQAAREANAYDFISKLPEKFNTMVGERGTQLSGGQKQRVAIARALVRDPKILLLDEATSALDTQSESIVQAALDKARAGRTTIVIAHRLSTIRTADSIAVFHGGVVVEQGTHSELMEKEGVYHSLVMLQNQGKDSDTENQSTDNSYKYGNSGLYDMGEKQDKEDKWPTLQDVENMLEPIKNERLRKVSTRKENKEELIEMKPRNTNTGILDEEGQRRSVTPLRRILQLNKPEWIFIVTGMLAAAVSGCIYPLFAANFSNIIATFGERDPIQKVQKINQALLTFVVLGFSICIGYVIMGFMFGKSGENLTMRLKSLSFKALLRQLTGHRVGVLTRTVTTLLAIIGISFAYGWQLALLIVAFVPILAGALLIETLIMENQAFKKQKALEEAGKISTEVVENIRTVVSLTKEDVFYEKYNAILTGSYRNTLKSAPIYGLACAIAETLQFIICAPVFSLGGWLVAHCYIYIENVFLTIFIVSFTARKVAHPDSFTLNLGAAKFSAERIFKLVDRIPAIDIYSEEGQTLKQMEGNLEFKNIQFVYPTRPNVQILQGLNLKVSKGQTLALVGSSGCGKSTVVQLLERFYDAEEGQVLADGIDITSLHLKWLRSQIGIVSQEPILFDCSIKENIQYGDNSRLVPEEEVIEAAKAANIHTFIMNLPEGYNTRVGDKGAQLSGGQKQRIAIARALVRKPKVLLLDEATSALDTESEKIVQQALDSARQGRTCIVIAHRLSTIQNADIIAVIKNGKVVEYGTHNQLLANQADYYALVNTHDSDN